MHQEKWQKNQFWNFESLEPSSKRHSQIVQNSVLIQYPQQSPPSYLHSLLLLSSSQKPLPIKAVLPVHSSLLEKKCTRF